MSRMQPQHPDVVSLIGSLWDSSAAFAQWIPARRQQVGSDGAAVSKQAKDGGRCLLFSSALRRNKKKTTQKKKLARVPGNSRFSAAAFLNGCAESGTLGTARKPSVCHPRIIVACRLPPNCASATFVFSLSKWTATKKG